MICSCKFNNAGELVDVCGAHVEYARKYSDAIITERDRLKVENERMNKTIRDQADAILKYTKKIDRLIKENN